MISVEELNKIQEMNDQINQNKKDKKNDHKKKKKGLKLKVSSLFQIMVRMTGLEPARLLTTRT